MRLFIFLSIFIFVKASFAHLKTASLSSDKTKYYVTCSNTVVPNTYIKAGMVSTCDGVVRFSFNPKIEAIINIPELWGYTILCGDKTWEYAHSLFDTFPEESTLYFCNPCNGWKRDGRCWYMAKKPGMTCNEVCRDHGGFNEKASIHKGVFVSQHFKPDYLTMTEEKRYPLECANIKHKINIGANGEIPYGDRVYDSDCYVSCACNK